MEIVTMKSAKNLLATENVKYIYNALIEKCNAIEQILSDKEIPVPENRIYIDIQKYMRKSGDIIYFPRIYFMDNGQELEYQIKGNGTFEYVNIWDFTKKSRTKITSEELSVNLSAIYSAIGFTKRRVVQKGR